MSDLQQNLQQANTYLQRFKDNTTGHYINGEWTLGTSGKTFTNISPADQQPLGEIAEGGEVEVNRACEAAQDAFAEWRDITGAERKKILNRLADKLVERADEIALVESSDCGQAIRFMKQAAVRGAANFRFFAVNHVFEKEIEGFRSWECRNRHRMDLLYILHLSDPKKVHSA